MTLLSQRWKVAVDQVRSAKGCQQKKRDRAKKPSRSLVGRGMKRSGVRKAVELRGKRSKLYR